MFAKGKKVKGKNANILFPQFLFLSFSFAPPSSNVCQRVLVNIPSKHSGTNSLCLCSFLSPCGFSVCGPHAVYLMLTFSCKWQTQTHRDHTKPFTNSQQDNSFRSAKIPMTYWRKCTSHHSQGCGTQTKTAPTSFVMHFSNWDGGQKMPNTILVYCDLEHRCFRAIY